jgi:hypothetical protein
LIFTNSGGIPIVVDGEMIGAIGVRAPVASDEIAPSKACKNRNQACGFPAGIEGENVKSMTRAVVVCDDRSFCLGWLACSTRQSIMMTRIYTGLDASVTPKKSR